jgi:hypothetical protein
MKALNKGNKNHFWRRIMYRQFIGIFLLLVILAGCQSIQGDRAAPDAGTPQVNTEGMKKGCFYINKVDDWKALTSVNLIVYAPTRSKPYLLTISPPSKHMNSDQTIGFEAGLDGGRVCGRVGDRLIMREGVAMSFAVVDVRHLDEAAAKELLSQKESGNLPLVVPVDTSPGVKAEGKPD